MQRDSPRICVMTCRGTPSPGCTACIWAPGSWRVRTGSSPQLQAWRAPAIDLRSCVVQRSLSAWRERYGLRWRRPPCLKTLLTRARCARAERRSAPSCARRTLPARGWPSFRKGQWSIQVSTLCPRPGRRRWRKRTGPACTGMSCAPKLRPSPFSPPNWGSGPSSAPSTRSPRRAARTTPST